jgi:hypothetical protein
MANLIWMYYVLCNLSAISLKEMPLEEMVLS